HCRTRLRCRHRSSTVEVSPIPRHGAVARQRNHDQGQAGQGAPVAFRELAAAERAAAGHPPSPEEALALLATPAPLLPDLLAAATAMRDRGRGRRMTFSAKVFVPLTNLCRDYCG